MKTSFFSGRGDALRNLLLYLDPKAEYLLDWFHVTMRLTVLHQPPRACRWVSEGDEKCELKAPTLKVLESIKWCKEGRRRQ